MKRGRVPATREDVWSQSATCVGCGKVWLHVEVGDGFPDDRQYGLPLWLRCPDCNGELVASVRDVA